MDVVFRDERQVVVDHERKLDDVEAAGRDIGRDQHPHATCGEPRQGTRARALALVAVDDRRTETSALEMFADAIRAALRLAEDERLTGGCLRQDMQKQRLLAIEVHRMNAMCDRGRDSSLVRHVHTPGLACEFCGKPHDVRRERCREEQCLPRSRQRRQHAAKRGEKAHVEHAVGLVERENFDRRQVDRPSLQVIDEPARCGDDDVGAVRQRPHLWRHRHPTKDVGDTQPHGCAVCRERAVHLDGQLARRHEHESERPTPLRALPSQEEALDHRERERSGLTSSGLGAREKIDPAQDERNRRGLDWCGLRVAHLARGAYKERARARVSKTALNSAPAWARAQSDAFETRQKWTHVAPARQCADGA